MFIVKTCNAHLSDLSEHTRRKTPAGYSKLVSHKIEAMYKTWAPFGFQLALDDYLAIGESIKTTTPSQIESLAEYLRSGGSDARALGPDFLTFALVDFRSMHLVVVTNVGCTRWCYYHISEGSITIGSSVRMMNRLGTPMKIDDSRYPEFLTYRFVVPPSTLFQDIYKTIGGQKLTFDLSNNSIVSDQRFAFFAQRSDTAPSLETTISTVAEELKSTIAKQLKSYDAPGILLSGGLDSGLISMMAQAIRPDIRSVSSSFRFINPGDSETEYALTFAEASGIPHEVHRTDPDAYLRGLVDSIFFNEEPIHHLQSVVLFLIFRDNPLRQDMLLSGEGADGLFGNDVHHVINKRAKILRVMNRLGVTNIARFFYKLARSPGYRLHALTRNFGVDGSDEYHVLWSLGEYVDADLVADRFGVTRDTIIESRRNLLTDYSDAALLDQTTILSLLTEASVSMSVWSNLAHSQGIATHYPFAAPAVVDAALDCDWNTKTQEPKFVIREILRQLNVPEEFVAREKLSFAFPIEYWSRPGTFFQPIVDMMRDGGNSFPLDELQTGDKSDAMLLWNMINHFLWRRLIVEDTSPSDLAEELTNRRRHAMKAAITY